MKKLVIVWAALVLLVIIVALLPNPLDTPEENPDFGIEPFGAIDWNFESAYRMGWQQRPEGRPFDVIYVNSERTGELSIHFESNDGKTLCLDRENSRFEKYTFGFWFDAPAREGFDSALEHIELEQREGLLRGRYIYDLDAEVNFGNPGKETYYRLIAAFTENADGSGERYEFRLRIVTLTNKNGGTLR